MVESQTTPKNKIQNSSQSKLKSDKVKIAIKPSLQPRTADFVGPSILQDGYCQIWIPKLHHNRRHTICWWLHLEYAKWKTKRRLETLNRAIIDRYRAVQRAEVPRIMAPVTVLG